MTANKTASEKEIKQVRNATGLLYLATRSVRILTNISWTPDVRERFFAQGAKELPQVTYPDFDPTEALERIVLARASFNFDPMINDWLNLLAYNIETSAKMLAARGTEDFFRYSSELYGTPDDQLSDQENSTLDLATEVDKKFEEFQSLDLGGESEATVTAEMVAAEMKKDVAEMFGDQAPSVYVEDDLSANALAGPSRIRIRRGAKFTGRDIRQLINHESHIHVATFLNGHSQENLQILGASHPGITKTQEGLAVFAEFITGSMDLARFQRLADRVIAIKMATDGADFLQVYQFYLEKTDDPEQAFENTRRVFRGGVLTGGAPFTKDIVYLDGLIRVHNFLRTMVSSGRADCLRLLFCGKLDLEDLPIIGHFAERGICKPPTFLPTWAQDLRFLLCYLTYSSFLNRIDLSQVKNHYVRMLDRIPRQDL
jgi:uncharacterized protein (TIGR02421 family)